MPPGHADAARCKDDMRRMPATPPLVALEDEQSPHGAILDDQVVRERAPENLDGRRPAGPLDEGTHYYAAGRVAAGMDHARSAMSRLAGQFERAVQRAVERHAFVDQQPQAVGAFTRQRQRAAWIAEPGASRQRILGVGLRGVPGPHRRSDTALGPEARTAFERCCLGDQRHAPRGQRQRGYESRHSGTDDDDVICCNIEGALFRHRRSPNRARACVPPPGALFPRPAGRSRRAAPASPGIRKYWPG